MATFNTMQNYLYTSLSLIYGVSVADVEQILISRGFDHIRAQNVQTAISIVTSVLEERRQAVKKGINDRL